AIYTTDARGRLTYFNTAAVRLSGRTPELGTDQWCVTWKIFLADGTPLPHDQCPMAVALNGCDVPNGIEFIAERPDGTRFWFTPYPAILRDAEGRIIGGINVLMDITDRKNAEIDVNEQFRAIVETTPDCVQIVAPDGTLLFMNSPGLAMVGASSAAEVTGQSVYDFIAAGDRDGFRQFNESVCRGQKGSIEFDIAGRQGARYHVETHAAPLRHVDGSIVHLAVTRDITDRKSAERAALLLGAIVDSSDDAIISKDLNSTITSWNHSAERLFGYTAAEMIGQPVTILIPADRQDEEPRILERLRRGERVNHFETVRRRKDGTLVAISLTISPIRDRSGNIIGASKIARDITDRKIAEAAQKSIADELRRANEDLEQFAFSASHDLQEPLRTIKVYSELLQQDCGDAIDVEAKGYLRHICGGATRMQMLIRDLLTYTQVAEFEKPGEPFDAGEAVAAALSGLSGLIAETSARITAGPLPTLSVHATHLEQLFQNLIGNAIKYRSPARTPVVHVTAERQGGEWVFAVSDNGIGIAPEHKEKIFGLFKRLHTNAEYSGTGIGLSICRRIVDRYHGRIWVDAEPGAGSTFRFTLPV
ncbi:MAG TPA: PAS domain S-box protein, partial [Bryobacteraceae bacterium]|nr:PAS domain S-box protein [Bryobacteraceae bacterium]